MCHEDDIAASKSKLKEGLHFDVRQFNFLKYCEPNEDIKKQLFNRILAIEGEGPLLTAEAEG